MLKKFGETISCKKGGATKEEQLKFKADFEKIIGKGEVSTWEEAPKRTKRGRQQDEGPSGGNGEGSEDGRQGGRGGGRGGNKRAR